MVSCFSSNESVISDSILEKSYEISKESAMETLGTMFPELMRTTRVGTSEIQTLRRSDLGMTTRSEIGDISFANNAYYDYNFLTLIYQYRQ